MMCIVLRVMMVDIIRSVSPSNWGKVSNSTMRGCKAKGGQGQRPPLGGRYHCKFLFSGGGWINGGCIGGFIYRFQIWVGLKGLPHLYFRCSKSWACGNRRSWKAWPCFMLICDLDLCEQTWGRPPGSHTKLFQLMENDWGSTNFLVPWPWIFDVAFWLFRIWIWGLLRHTATSLFMDICTSLREFRAVAWR